MHLHSAWSDGAYSPRELARRAKGAGVQFFSLTDHDTMGGNAEAERAAAEEGLLFVRGWEISAYEGACKVHILGYGCREGEAYFSFLRRRKEGARLRAEDMISRANALFGTDVTMEDAERFHAEKSAPIHTMHVVNAFAEHLKRDAGELYSSAFSRGGGAYSGLYRPTPREAIEVIRAAGGVAVAAHPGRIFLFGDEEAARFRIAPEHERAEMIRSLIPRTDAFLRGLAAYGLGGIECHYPTHTAEETERFLALARECGLLVTGGSDFHAEGRGREIGLPPFDASEAAERLLSRGCG